jgi:hypothetical protein
LATHETIPNGELKPVGLKRKIPDADRWCYSSPTYQFSRDYFDELVLDFLSKHLAVGRGLEKYLDDIEYAIFNICPVGQTFEDEFSCLLTRKTLDVLSRLRLSLEIAPSAVMPEFDDWVML